MKLNRLINRLVPLITVIAVLVSMAVPSASAAGFLDIQGHKQEAEINRALDAGLIGLGTGYFRPDANITRAEMAEIVYGLVPLTVTVSRSFSDLSGSESYAAALKAVCAGGYLYLPSGSEILPNDLVSREEAAYLVYKLFKLPAGSGALPGEADSDAIAYKEAVSALYTGGYFPATMTTSSWFSPRMAITRAEFIGILCNAFGLFAGREQYSGATVYANVYALTDDAVPTGLAATGKIYIGKAENARIADRVYLTSYWNSGNVADVEFTSVISSYTTYFAAGNSGRNQNIALASSYISGTVLLPGEEFSYNDTVGVRSAERGFQMASIYVGNEKVPGLGGGVCQVSSTVFCAAMFGAQTITSRHPHSMRVDYSYAGYDATVYYGSLDFRFRNDLEVPVKIVIDVSKTSGYITVSLFAPEGYVKPDVKVDVTLSGDTYTTTRYINGIADYSTKTRYSK